MSLSLFEQEAIASGVTLRDYQIAQSQSIRALWRLYQSVLLVSSVGSGKTTTFCHLTHERLECGRTLIMAHRTELVDQAIARLKLFGIRAARDQAGDRAEHHRWAEKVIVGTVQTIAARIGAYNPDDFATVIIDESHHAVAKTYKKIVEHFKKNPNCKILGVTGTPDRGDEAALGQVFEAVAEPVFGIGVAIKQGYLVKPLQRLIDIEELDVSKCRTTAGDLNGADLAKIVEDRKLCLALADAISRESGSMSTLAFAATVAQAEILSDCLNDIRHGSSGWVCGKTPDDERRKVFADHAALTIQYLVNVGIATEGTDMPHVRCVANARFTKSRALYEQISGRAVRTEPGVIDGIDSVDGRIAAIAASGKPNALLLDFVGNSGKHKLITVVDILGGDLTKEVADIVTRNMRKRGKPSDVAEEIEAAQLEIKLRAERKAKQQDHRLKLRAQADYTSREVDPFNAHDSFHRENSNLRPTDKQIYFLKSHGHANAERYTIKQASAVIGKIKSSGGIQALSDKQQSLLKKHGYDLNGMTYADGKAAIDALAKNGWRKPVTSFTDSLVNDSAENYMMGEPAF